MKKLLIITLIVAIGCINPIFAIIGRSNDKNQPATFFATKNTISVMVGNEDMDYFGPAIGALLYVIIVMGLPVSVITDIFLYPSDSERVNEMNRLEEKYELAISKLYIGQSVNEVMQLLGAPQRTWKANNRGSTNEYRWQANRKYISVTSQLFLDGNVTDIKTNIEFNKALKAQPSAAGTPQSGAP